MRTPAISDATQREATHRRFEQAVQDAPEAEHAAFVAWEEALHSDVMAQLQSTTVATVVRDLLAWADIPAAVTAEAWRVPAGDRVHLSIASTLTGPTGTIKVDVFGAVDYDPVRFADLTAGDRCKVPLGQLRAWVAFDVPRDRR
jgi:hypothetical protein